MKNSERVGQVASRREYTGRVINLDLDQVRFPNGKVGELEMIRHSGASAVLPFLADPAGEDPTILLIRQYRYAADGFIYEIPAGRLEAGEPPEQCAVRELREETGCTAAKMEHLYTMYTTPGFTDEKDPFVRRRPELERGESALERDRVRGGGTDDHVRSAAIDQGRHDQRREDRAEHSLRRGVLSRSLSSFDFATRVSPQTMFFSSSKVDNPLRPC